MCIKKVRSGIIAEYPLLSQNRVVFMRKSKGSTVEILQRFSYLPSSKDIQQAKWLLE